MRSARFRAGSRLALRSALTLWLGFASTGVRADDSLSVSPTVPENLYTRRTEYTFGYDRMNSLASDGAAESLGLLTAKWWFHGNSGVRWGLGVVNAVSGVRGGFFGGGAGFGYQHAVYGDFHLDGEAFVGAAGGAGVPVGSGLFGRAALAALWNRPTFSFAAGGAWLGFPDGSQIRSFHPFVELRFSSQFSFLDPEPQAPQGALFDRSRWGWEGWRFTPMLKLLRTQNIKSKQGNFLSEQTGLFGLVADHFSGDSFFTTVQVFQGVTGNAPGYMSAAGGVGIRVAFSHAFALEPIAMLGWAGGANFDTDAGGFAELGGQASLRLWEGFTMLGGITYFRTFNGQLGLRSIHGGLGIRFSGLERKRLVPHAYQVAASGIPRSRWRLITKGQYLLAGTSLGGENFGTLGATLEYRIGPWISLHAGTAAAAAGRAGGFRMLYAGGALQAPLGVVELGARFSAGTGGGGGLSTGSGPFIQGMGEGVLNLDENWGLYGAAGKIRFLESASVTVVEGGLRFSFGLPAARGTLRQNTRQYDPSQPL